MMGRFLLDWEVRGTWDVGWWCVEGGRGTTSLAHKDSAPREMTPEFLSGATAIPPGRRDSFCRNQTDGLSVFSCRQMKARTRPVQPAARTRDAEVGATYWLLRALRTVIYHSRSASEKVLGGRVGP